MNMKSFLINASNLKAGGGLQVADSICGQLNRFSQHFFIVVLSSFLNITWERIIDYKNVVVYNYDIPNSFRTIVLGRDQYLDQLVEKYNIDAVLTIFGPSRWKPRVPHLSGFALPQLVIPESPFFMRMGGLERMKWVLWCAIRKWSFKRSANWFWTENLYISRRLETLFHTDNVYTVTNYYNQVFDCPDKWNRSIVLPAFDGTTCLSVSAPTTHKNFGIIAEILQHLSKNHPSFNVRFILTFDEEQWSFPKEVRNSIVFVGKTDVSECPFLYEQSDIMFMPTLLECFTATYPESMRMSVPIITTDMEFAKGLCGDAACYFRATDAADAAEAIFKVATDQAFAKQLVENGKRQLLTYDNYEQRAEKLITILEEISR